MYTELIKILEAGLAGDTQRARSYAELIVSKHYKPETNHSSPFDDRLARGFKNVLDGKVSDGNCTLDEVETKEE